MADYQNKIQVMKVLLNFFMFLSIIVIFLMVAYFMNKPFINKNITYPTNTSSSKAMSILNERFAKGEINEEEYKSKKNELQE